MDDKKFDITSTVLEKSIDLAKGFLEKITGSAFEETGLLISDNIKLIRFKNQIKILSKAKKLVDESGLKIKEISLKKLVPLLEYSSLEDEETLQNKWANLLVNYIDINEKYESTIFPFILSQLSSKEVIEIDRIYEVKETSERAIKLSGVDKSNLIRLGLLELIPPTHNNKAVGSLLQRRQISFSERFSSLNSNHIFTITELGIQFVECCSRKQ